MGGMSKIIGYGFVLSATVRAMLWKLLINKSLYNIYYIPFSHLSLSDGTRISPYGLMQNMVAKGQGTVKLGGCAWYQQAPPSPGRISMCYLNFKPLHHNIELLSKR